MKLTHLFIIVISLFVLRVVFFSILPITDQSESRYASMASEMADSNDYVTPKVRLDKCKMRVISASELEPTVYKNERGEFMAFWGKPPMNFWLSATMIKIFGHNGFGYRMNSHLCGILLLVIVFFTLKTSFDSKVAMIATSSLACSGAFYLISSVQMIDMTLMLFAIGAFFVNFSMLQVSDEEKSKKFWLKSITVVLLAFGFLTKGPIALAMLGIPLLVWIAFTKQWKLIKTYLWWPGVLIFTAICLPWFILAEMRTPGFSYYFFVNENFLRFVSKQYGDFYGSGHVLFHGVAIIFMLISILPLGLMTLRYWFKSDLNPVALLKDLRDKPAESYFFIGFMSMTLFWCLSPQLLLTYLIPLVPAFYAWGAIRYKDQINLKSYFKVVIFFLVLYPIVQISISPIVEERNSTRTLMAHVATSDSDSVRPIYFVRRTFDSAYLYGKNVINHPKESASASYEAINKLDDPIIIVNKRYLKDLPASSKKEWILEDTFNHWSIFRKRNSHGEK